MKRLICLMLAAVLLAGCGPALPETTERTEPTPPTETTRPTETTAPTEPTEHPALASLREDLPTMDGSTSLIPLEAGIRAAIFDISMEEATAQVRHTTTWGSFSNLLEGTVDMIFSCPLSQQQYDEAQTLGVTLELVPVAMEGFVFVVNADNPVDTLTQQQLKDIYSGRITNWSQVGGLDMPITAYQRNRDSGSQNFMLDFMGDTPLMDAPTELRPASMSGLMDVIAYNDNALGSIGYSVYAYAANMYGGANEIKFIRVDGTEPSKATFASGEYPLLGKNYAVFRADEPSDSPVRQLVDFMTSVPGQAAIAQAGYVTVLDIGFSYDEEVLELYSGQGTGPAAEAPASYEYELCTIEYSDWGIYDSPGFELTDNAVTQLADKELEGRINAFIAESLARMEAAFPEYEQHLARLNEGQEYPLYSSHEAPMVSVTCKNGYLSAVVNLGYYYNVSAGTECFYKVETATWDLLTGERLEPEDLFCQGVDVDEILNDFLLLQSQAPISGYDLSYRELKQEFAGLPTEGWHLTHDGIFFDLDDPYFTHGAWFDLVSLPEGTLAAQQPRDFSGALTGENTLARKQFRYLYRDTVYEYVEEVPVALLDEEAYPTARRINDAVRDYIRDHFTEEAVSAYYADQGLEAEGFYWPDWSLTNFGGRYALFQCYMDGVYNSATGRWVPYPQRNSLLFDLASGQEIPLREMFLPGWEEAANILRNGEIIDQPPDPNALIPQSISQSAFGLWIYLRDEDGTYFEVEVPTEYVNW